MQKFILDRDITIYCNKANSFPDGVLEAHQQLHKLVPFSFERNYFGISRKENNIIVYKAAAEELEEGDLSNFGLESFTILQGVYYDITILDFMKDPSSISKAFEELISQPDIDPNGYCIEWYLAKNEVKCLVKIN